MLSTLLLRAELLRKFTALVGRSRYPRDPEELGALLLWAALWWHGRRDPAGPGPVAERRAAVHRHSTGGYLSELGEVNLAAKHIV